MCGIGGILRVHPAGAEVPAPGESIPERWLDVLDESIKHRGPDGAGRFRDRAVRGDGSVVDVALVHRRLSIIDHAGGHQPMVSERGREGKGEGLVAVVFNGCIYNHRELRRELEGAGHRFVTDHSDTEVLVHGWREWGDGLFGRLDGMFALAIWDGGRGVLKLAHDLAREKPLLTTNLGNAGLMGFGSAAPGLMRLTAMIDELVERERPRWFYEPLERMREADPEMPDPHDAPEGTIGRGWRRAPVTPGWLESWIKDGFSCNTATPPVVAHPPATYITVDWPNRWNSESSGSYRQHRGRRKDAALTPERLDGLLAEAVASRLEADVPLGCFLSGGVDSSLIAAYAVRFRPDLRTFTVRMPDARYDESEYAWRCARHLGTDHTTLDCEPDPVRDLTMLIEQVGLPFGDSSLLPASWLSRAAREHVTVALSGDGGDELFGGYQRYSAERYLRRRYRLLRQLPDEMLPEVDPKSRGSKLARLIRAARWGGYRELLAVYPEPLFSELLGREPPEWVDPWTPLGDPLADDFSSYLPDDLLVKTDTASMAVALEVRAPLLATSVVDACLSEPLSSLMPGGKRKGLLRQVARKYLPAEIVDRPKMGFAIPVSEWFRSDYGGMKTLLMDRLRSVEPFGPPGLGIELDMKFVDRMIEEHMAGRRDHGQRLYMLLVLSIWAGWVGREMAK